MTTNQTWEVLHDSFYFIRKMKWHFLIAFILLFLPVCVVLYFLLQLIPIQGLILDLFFLGIAVSLFIGIVNELNFLYNGSQYPEQITYSIHLKRTLEKYFYYASNFIMMIPLLYFFALIISLIIMPLLMSFDNSRSIYYSFVFVIVLFCIKIIFPYVTYEGNNLFSALPKAITLFFSEFKSSVLLFLFSVLIQFAAVFVPFFIYSQLLTYSNNFGSQFPLPIFYKLVLGISGLLGIITNIWGISLFNFQYLRLKKMALSKKRR